MKFGTRATALIAILITALTSIPSAEAAGRSTTAVVNTILNGKGVPRSSLGIDGDFYIDTRSLLLYGPKTKGKWPTPQSIQGPTGPSGSDGKNGSDGKQASTSNINSVSGPQGPQGPQGIPGEKGEPGAPGSAGAMGAAGPAGAAGSTGPAGANGSNGAQGPTGPTGATGSTGSAGAAGATGAKGETGTVGPSEVTVIDIPTWTLSSATNYSYSNSASFGTLKADTSYLFNIYIKGTANYSSLTLGLDFVSPGSSINFSYTRSYFDAPTYSSVTSIYSIYAVGTIKVGGSDTSLQARVIDGFGNTGSYPLTLSGKAYITLVGAIK